MKKATICFLLIFTMMVSLLGCATDSWEGQSTNEALTESNNDTKSMSDTGSLETIPTENESVDTEAVSLPDVEASDKSATIYFAGEAFRKSIFSAGSNMLYIYGIRTDGEYFLGCMQMEEDIFQEFTVEMDEGMRAFNITVDAQGRCHILWMSVEKYEAGNQTADRITYEKSCITIVDNKGTLEKEIDVTDLFSSGYRRPFCFVVDREGNYYFEQESEIIQIKKNGTLGTIIGCDGSIQGIGLGKSGAVYCTYQREDGERGLGKLEENTFFSYELQLPQSDASYAGIYAGNDSELLLFSKETGVFACDGEYIENRVSEAELPIKGADITGYGMLSDGRICILEQTDECTVFYYIPSVK